MPLQPRQRRLAALYVTAEYVTQFGSSSIDFINTWKSPAVTVVDSHRTTPPPVEAPEAHQCAMLTREESAREASLADSVTVMRRVAEEEEEAVGSQADITPPPATRLARATPTREASAREVTAAVTTTRRKEQVTPLLFTTTAAETDLVASASPSRRVSVIVPSLAASPTRPLSHPATTPEGIRCGPMGRQSPCFTPLFLGIHTTGTNGDMWS